MLADEIKTAISQVIPDAVTEVRLEGNHAHLSVTSARFAGMMPVKKQQLVYSALQNFLADGSVHAVHMKTLTPDEMPG